MDILYKMKSFCMIEFDQDDIVRSGLVREYILAKNDLPDEYTEFWRDSTDHYQEQFEERKKEEEKTEGFLENLKLF